MVLKFKRGDRLAIDKGLAVTHFGIYLGEGMVIDNSNFKGMVAERSLEEFSSGCEVRRVPVSSRYPPDEVVDRARERIGQPYGWFNQNCEHFVNEVQLGKPTSTQAIIGGGLILFLGYKLLAAK